MSTVYVVQKTLSRSRETGEWVSKFDLSPAEDYGELVYLLDPKDDALRPVPVIKKLQERLSDFTAQDYLLLIGNPCLIGWSVAIAAKSSGGVVRALQWNHASRSYILVEANLG